MIHVYSGSGKGKTTAVAGLAVRCFGHGKRVVFAQFLKTSKTGELASFGKLGIPVIRSLKNLGWTFKMNEAQKAECRLEQQKILSGIVNELNSSFVDLLILDEALDAISTGMLDDDDFKKFLQSIDSRTEIAITGRPVPAWLLEKCDYYSNIEKVKHPYDKGLSAREGIEI
ncbi:MAG: cob(I)yrinic acid a,c-diamide adenosyltransferase [Termitinemataceae bacterium]|nr:MAG: cob(I)yrinic acid a,c-diamide adenosyltransferase [Termitinemataceae bacterium]